MSHTADTNTDFTLDESAFFGGFASAMEAFCCELLWDCDVDEWALNDSELDMIRQALTKAHAGEHDEVCDVIAHQFRIDAHTLRLIDKGYCLNLPNSYLWVASADDVLTVLSREGVEALDIDDALSIGLVEYQASLPSNPRYHFA